MQMGASELVLDNEEDDVEKAVLENKLTLDNPAECLILMIQGFFWLPVWHDTFSDTGTETKANGGRRIDTI